MMLIASNSERSCLFSFNAHSSIQPIMQFSPYFIGMPKETGILFPALQTETSFITGTQILSGTQTAGRDCKDFISIAQLTTNGDIYMQDFWRLNSETPKQLILTSITSSDKKQNISNKKDMKDDFDEASKVNFFVFFLHFNLIQTYFVLALPEISVEVLKEKNIL